jgi:hypothetical protein
METNQNTILTESCKSIIDDMIEKKLIAIKDKLNTDTPLNNDFMTKDLLELHYWFYNTVNDLIKHSYSLDRYVKSIEKKHNKELEEIVNKIKKSYFIKGMFVSSIISLIVFLFFNLK